MRLCTLLMFVVGSTGCAAILGTHEKQFNVQSAPEGADVYLDGSRLGTAPLTVRLSNHKTHTFTYRKDGYKDASCTLTRSTGGGWVILDVLFGLAPIIIDAATNNWSQTSGSVCVGHLEAVAADAVAVHAPVNVPQDAGSVTSMPQFTAASDPRSASSPPVVVATVDAGRAPVALAVVASGAGRFNGQLRSDPSFRLSIEDLIRLGVVADYQETRAGLLRVMLGGGYSTSSSAAYSLGRLWSAYAKTTENPNTSVVELWSNGRKIGECTSQGMLIGPEYSAPR